MCLMAQKKSLISENEETIYSVKLGFQILERWGGYGSKTDPFRVPSFKIQKKKKEPPILAEQSVF